MEMALDQILLKEEMRHCQVGTQCQMSHQMEVQRVIQLIQTMIQKIQMIQAMKVHLKNPMSPTMVMKARVWIGAQERLSML